MCRLTKFSNSYITKISWNCIVENWKRNCNIYFQYFVNLPSIPTDMTAIFFSDYPIDIKFVFFFQNSDPFLSIITPTRKKKILAFLQASWGHLGTKLMEACLYVILYSKPHLWGSFLWHIYIVKLHITSYLVGRLLEKYIHIDLRSHSDLLTVRCIA